MDKTEQKIRKAMKKLPPHNEKTCRFCDNVIIENATIQDMAEYAKHLESKDI